MIENAFKHGVSNNLPSFIRICITYDKTEVHCRIENSYFPKNGQDKSGSGIGLVNLEKRLELIYPESYSFRHGQEGRFTNTNWSEMKLTCAIIDDEPLAASLLESYALKTPFLELKGKYNSALNAMDALHNEPVQVLFLDIQMPELSGMEFSKMLPAETKVIFTTAFEQYAVDSYRVNALDYLLKPISYSDFLKAAQKACDWFESHQRKTEEPITGTANENEVERIFVKTEYKLVQIELNQILYIEGLKDYVKIYLEDEARPILSLISMKMVEDMLPSNRFIRVHRSFIVQPEKIKVIERNRIVFGKEYIPISDNYKQKFFDFLAQHSILLAK